jgi:hypothetical protein
MNYIDLKILFTLINAKDERDERIAMDIFIYLVLLLH